MRICLREGEGGRGREGGREGVAAACAQRSRVPLFCLGCDVIITYSICTFSICCTGYGDGT